MTVAVRRSEQRGHADHGWLRTFHTFSFADYHDPEHVQFRALRVLNEDHVAPGTGFGMHPHRDMEILTWVLAGALRHEDSMGNGAVIRPGEVQIMSAGTGVLHSEHNASETEPVHLLQIWILPDRRGLPPRYDQRAVDPASMRDRLLTIAAPPGEPATVVIHQDVRIHATELGPGKAVELPLARGRHAWVQVARGGLTLAGIDLRAGDGAAVTGEAQLRLTAGAAGVHALVFDLA
jgi:redox-sensitive bicupin YhaK (pirin superfamily)